MDGDNGNKRASGSSGRSFALLAIVGILVLMGWQRFAPVKSAVDWRLDYSASLADAAAKKMPVLLAFTSAGCVYCREMEADVFPQEAVLAELGHFIPVKIDAWADEELSAKYRIDALPGYVITDSSGKPVAAIAGYQPADRFIEFLKLGAKAVGASQS